MRIDAFWQRKSSVRFSLPMVLDEALDAVHRALPTVDWAAWSSEASDYDIHGRLPMTMTFSAPPPESGARASLIVRYRGLYLARISLVPSGAAATDVVLVAERPLLVNLRRPLEDLRRSIELGAGSLHPFQPG